MYRLYKILLFIFALLWNCSLFAQSIEAQFSTLAGTKGQLPFWLWANQLGRYDQYSSSIQNFELRTAHLHNFNNSDFSWEGRADFNLLLADKNDIRFTELYEAINWKFLQLKVGAFGEEDLYEGLSTTNGNLSKSRNARPHPRLRLGFNRFVPLFVDWISVYGYFEEGVLNDDRYVYATRLHNKALYLRFGDASKIQVTVGGEHLVMWGGTHPSYGKLQGWEAYLDYVMGNSGDENALTNDQINVVGNGYGTYQFKMHKVWEKLGATFYISHPFDDRSGMNLINWRDNLFGLSLSKNKEVPFLKTLLFEYYYTKHQSGSYHQKEFPDGSIHGSGLDNYYNHGIYRSGATYQQMAMVSPLFAPIIVKNGISVGFENTRFSGIHMAAKGFINPSLQWKAMCTYTHNLGKYKSEITNTYDPPRKQTATLLQISWQLQNSPLVLSASMAADHGTLFDNGQSTTRIGSQFSILWKILQ